MKLGLGLGISFGGGGGGPYASAIAAYDFTTASGYVLNTGRVETLVDQSPNGRNLGQATVSLKGTNPMRGKFAATLKREF